MDDPTRLYRVTLIVCVGCLEGIGSECHTPGCAFWFSDPPVFRDVPIVALEPVERAAVEP